MHFIFKFLIGFFAVALLIVIVGLAYLKFIAPPNIKIPKKATREEKIEILDKWLAGLQVTNQFNGSVLLAKDGKIILDKSYGYADLAKKQPLSEESSFNLASLSKPFTALGVLMLVEQGKINLDEPISNYLPLLDYPEVKVRHLLNHTSGLPDYMNLVLEHWEDENLAFKNSDLLDLYNKYTPKLLFTPGDKYEYSNTGYVVLAALIESVSKMSFEAYMDQKVFKPLDMKNTSVFNLLSDENKLSHRVWGMDGDKLNDLIFLDGVAGDGGIYSTTLDLLKWVQALNEGGLISKESLKTAYTAGVLNSGEQTDYGLGWVIEDNNVYWHNGSWVGFSSYLRQDLDNNTLAIFLDSGSNSTTSFFLEIKLANFIKEF